MASKVLRSNLAHKKLASKYDKISVSLKDSTAKQFWSVVKRDYHNDVCLKQSTSNKLLSFKEKREIFDYWKKDLISYRKYVNKNFHFNRFIPKEEH